MTGSVNPEHLPVLALNGASHENPVQCADDDVRADPAVSKGAAESGLSQTWHQAGMSAETVEIPGDDDGCLSRILLGVVENFLHLLQTQFSGTFALQVEIVNYQRLAAIIELGYQGYASALAPLEQRDARHEQLARLPESRLMLEADHTRGADREGGEQCLSVICRILGGALAQFLKLGREDIVHAESFGEFFRDIFSMRAARAQIHLLEDAQIGFDLADLFLNVVQVLAALDVPIQNGGVGANAGRVGIVSR